MRSVCRASALAFAARANAIAADILSCFEDALELPPGFFNEVCLIQGRKNLYLCKIGQFCNAHLTVATKPTSPSMQTPLWTVLNLLVVHL